MKKSIYFTTLIDYFKEKVQNGYSNKKILTFIFLILGFLLFKKGIDTLIENYPIKYLFRYVESSGLTDVTILILTGLICAVYTINMIRKKWINSESAFMVSLLAALYIGYRFIFTSNWDYYSFHSPCIERFYYTDVIFIILLFHFINTICVIKNEIRTKISQKKNPRHNESIFALDKNIISQSQDLTNRKVEAKKIAQEITKIYDKNSFAIGINGEWGSGKTSFAKMVLEDLKISGDNIIIEFNPWCSESYQTISSDFFDVLKENLNNYNALSKKIKAYTNKLSQPDSKIIYGINYLIGSDESLGTLHEAINNLIKRINKKIIILIDDIDRLDQMEIVEVLKIIRNTANFENTIFIACYDRHFVNEAIKYGLNKHNSELYLNKIFQYEHKLRPVNEKMLANKVAEELEIKFPDKKEEIRKALRLDNVSLLEMNKDEREDFLNNPLLINCYIKNFRDLNRFCNSFVYNYSFIKEEVVFGDYLYVELLRISYSNVYDRIQGLIKLNTSSNTYDTNNETLDTFLKENESTDLSIKTIKRTFSYLFKAPLPSKHD